MWQEDNFTHEKDRQYLWQQVNDSVHFSKVFVRISIYIKFFIRDFNILENVINVLMNLVNFTTSGAFFNILNVFSPMTFLDTH